MRKLSILVAGCLLASAVPASASHEENRKHSAMQHIGGHARHMHRDWSGSQGRGHVHNICWDWDALEGWVWTCR